MQVNDTGFHKLGQLSVMVTCEDSAVDFVLTRVTFRGVSDVSRTLKALWAAIWMYSHTVENA